MAKGNKKGTASPKTAKKGTGSKPGKKVMTSGSSAAKKGGGPAKPMY